MQSYRFTKRKSLDPVGSTMALPKPTRQESSVDSRSASDRKSLDSRMSEASKASVPRCACAQKVQVEESAGAEPPNPTRTHSNKTCLRTSITEQPQHAEIAARAAAE
eukprot:1544167-Prymnesium_polylepis.2